MHEKPLKMPQNRRSARLFKILKKSQKSAIFPNLPDESSQNDHFFAYLREKIICSFAKIRNYEAVDSTETFS